MILKPLKRNGEQCVSVSLNELLQLSNYPKKLKLGSLQSKSSLAGQRASRLLARGMEFAESRRYQAGDDIRNIDWRVTARTGHTHTKLFAAEKERPILLGVDMRSPMFFATQGVFKSVQAALMMGHLAWSVSRTGDRLGGIIFDNQEIQEFRPSGGKRGVLPFLNGLAKHTNFPFKNLARDSLTSNSMMDRAIGHLRQLATPGSLVFIVSDFRDFTPFARNQLLQISRHSDLYICFVYDPIEASFPKNGVYPISAQGVEQQINTFDKSGLEKYKNQFLERRANIASLKGHQRIHFIECRTDEDCFDVLLSCFG